MSEKLDDNKEKRTRNDNWNGTISYRQDGRWEAKISIENERKSFYGKSEAEVKKKLREYRSKKASRFYDGKKVKLCDYMIEWLTTNKFGVVKQSTYDRYENTFNYHIKNESIGNKQIGSIDKSDIQKLLVYKMNPQKNGIKPLSKSSIKKIVELLSGCFNYAVSQGDMKINPCNNVVIPANDNFIVKTKEMYCLEPSELSAIKKVADQVRKNGEPTYRYADVYMVMLNTGLRCGEILALLWDDIDFQNNFIRINKSVMSNIKVRDNTISKKRHSVITIPKTKNSIRTIPMNEQAKHYLLKIKEYNETNKIDSDYVVCTTKGTNVSERNLQRTFDLVLEKAKVKHCGLHILRHSFGSTLIRKGVDVSVVSKLMGHSNTNITYSKYIHIIDEQKAQAMNLLNIV